jgi:sugar/nucleoside kinase (ribokinase family)
VTARSVETTIEGAAMSRRPVLTVVGQTTIDYSYLLPSHPAEDSENPVVEHFVCIGGTSGRAALAAARLGAEVHLLSMIGRGRHADTLVEELAGEPLRTTLIAAEEPCQHSCILIAADTGTRTTVWVPQPRADDRLLAAVASAVAQADMVLVDATDLELCRAALAAAATAEVPAILDTGSYKPWVDQLLGDVAYIVSPDKHFTRIDPNAAIEDTLQSLYERFRPTLIAATQGALGGMYLDADGLHRYPAFPVAVVDTCGAGDSFHGGFAWAVSAGLPVADCFRVAAWVAACQVTALGNTALPDADALRRFLAEPAG